MRITATKTYLQLVLLVLVITTFSGNHKTTAYGQEPQPPIQEPPPSDPIEQLHLTPEQRQQIRAIREESRQERALVNQRLREANVALQQTLDSDTLDETVIEQRVKDVAAAQAAAMRTRILTEVRIRRVLTHEQVTTLRTLRLRAQRLMRDRNPNRRALRPATGIRPNRQNRLAPRRNTAPPRDRP